MKLKLKVIPLMKIWSKYRRTLLPRCLHLSAHDYTRFRPKSSFILPYRDSFHCNRDTWIHIFWHWRTKLWISAILSVTMISTIICQNRINGSPSRNKWNKWLSNDPKSYKDIVIKDGDKVYLLSLWIWHAILLKLDVIFLTFELFRWTSQMEHVRSSWDIESSFGSETPRCPQWRCA